MAKKILVTGGTGLVGHGIRAALADEQGKHADEEWKFLSSKDCDLINPAEVDALFEREKPTHVIHLAAKVGGLFKNMAEKAGMWSDNILMNENILRSAQKHGVQKLVSCLSTCIFPDKTEYPIDETMLHDGPPHPSNEGYAYAKRMLEVASRCYRDQYGSNFVSVIPTNIFGPHDNYNLQDAHVIPALVHKCYLAKQSGGNFEVKGTGKPLRQFIYSKDLGKIMIAVLRNYNEVAPIILTPEEEWSIADVARMIAEKFEMGDKLVFVEGADGQFRKTASGVKLRHFLAEHEPGWSLTPIDKALGDSIQWFTDNYETARK